jgi:hypothetical protein
MAEVGLFQGIMRDLTGRGLLGGTHQIRLVLQPLLGFLLGIRFGVRDGKQGRAPFLQSLFPGHGRGLPVLRAALRDAIVPLCLAFILDSILQHMILGYVRPLAAVIVGTVLVFIPFTIGRALGNGVWRASRNRHVPHTR